MRPPRPLRPRAVAPASAALGLALGLAALAAAPRAAHGTQVVAATLEQLTAASQLVAVVTALDQRVTLRAGERVTRVRLRVDEVLAGAAREGSTLTLVLPGGTLDGVRDEVDGAPSARDGARYVLFARALPAALDGPEAYALTHLTAGLAELREAPEGAATVARVPGLVAPAPLAGRRDALPWSLVRERVRAFAHAGARR